MDIFERGKKYAEDKAISALNSVIEQAYIDGYNDGLKHLEMERLEAVKEGVEYVDLGLPSETLWSSQFLKWKDCLLINKLPYLEASKLSIPTKEQYEELCRECFPIYHSTKEFSGYKITGPSGKSISLAFVTIDGFNKSENTDQFYFWLKDDKETNEKLAAKPRVDTSKIVQEYKNCFAGLKLPVLLVSTK